MTVLIPSDEELLIRCGERDQAAWRTIVKRYERLVYAIPLREGLSPSQAAEVAQDTFTALFTSLDAIREPDRLSAWLAAVTRRNVWRRSKKEPATSLLPEEGLGEDSDFVHDHCEFAAAYAAVQSLEEPCRTPITGLFLDPAEPDYAELAAQLGRPLGSIGPLRGRCLGRVRQALECGTTDVQ